MSSASAAACDGSDCIGATTNTTATTAVTVSAPGKILLAGGYLVLESPNVGVVLAVNKRFYCTTQCKYPNKKKNDNHDHGHNNDFILLIVTSPQFDNMTWKYRYHIPTMQLNTYDNGDDDTAIAVVAPRNDLIEKTLAVALLALLPSNNNNDNNDANNLRHLLQPLPCEIVMTIHGDNDFYSLVPHLQAAQLPRTWHGIQQLASFLPVVIQQSSNSNTNTNTSSSNSKVLKTGLGSSACLVTSLVAALSVVFQQQQHKNEQQQQQQQQEKQQQLALSKNEIFALAQICHSHAQGKIGSGFDVAAACYGSCIYQRICLSGDDKEERLSKLLSDLETMTTTTNNTPADASAASAAITSRRNAATRECLLKTMNDIVEWTTHGGNDSNSPCIKPLSLPSFLQVMLADVAGGSESPSMARTVLAWKQSQAAATVSNDKKNAKIPHWDDLKECNAKIATLLQELSGMQTMNFNDDDDDDNNDNSTENDTQQQLLLQLLITQPATKWKQELQQLQQQQGPGNVSHDQQVLLVTRLLDLRHASIQARFHLKSMGQAAGSVPIEPDSQTELANATSNLPGVITALVPGAGGYDALCCLYIHHPTVQQGIGQLWADWKHISESSSSSSTMVICPLGVQAVNYGQGVRVESASPI